MVLFLTLACLSLLYVSANHYLHDSENEQFTESTTVKNVIKYDFSLNEEKDEENKVEFRTNKPPLATKKLGKRIFEKFKIHLAKNEADFECVEDEKMYQNIQNCLKKISDN